MALQAVPLEIRNAALPDEASDSLAKTIFNLKSGASHTLTRKIALTEATPELVRRNADQIHDIGRSHMARAKAASQGLHTYRGEISYDLASPRGNFDVLVHFVITRTA